MPSDSAMTGFAQRVKMAKHREDGSGICEQQT